MRHTIIRLSDGLDRLARLAAIGCLTAMFVTVMIQVIARYVLDAPPVWTDEVARYLMVWTGLLGATLSFKTCSDAVLMDSLAPPPPHPLGRIAAVLRGAAVAVFMLPVLYFCVFGLHGTFWHGYLARQARLTADTIGIPMIWIALAVPLCAATILIHLAARWAGPSEVHDDTGTIGLD